MEYLEISITRSLVVKCQAFFFVFIGLFSSWCSSLNLPWCSLYVVPPALSVSRVKVSSWNSLHCTLVNSALSNRVIVLLCCNSILKWLQNSEKKQNPNKPCLSLCRSKWKRTELDVKSGSRSTGYKGRVLKKKKRFMKNLLCKYYELLL